MSRSCMCVFCALFLAISPLHADSYAPVEPVGQAATEGCENAKKNHLTWQKVALITSIFAIAVVTVVLVTQYNGHKK